jgi:hypothetical protein
MSSMSCSTTYPKAQTHPHIIAMTASKRATSKAVSVLVPAEAAGSFDPD